jgi:UDP-N-acetylmuramoyl-L-alanyl-D-glutamate--2,6-diaminopimelate ligase
VLSFGVESDADVRALNVRLGSDGARFDCAYDGATYPAMLPLLAAYNVQNALAAVAACVSMGLEAEAVVADLSTVPQVPGRLERIAETPCPVLRDYAHTPDALYRALAALRPLTRGRLIVVFGAGGDRDRGKRPIMGHVAQAGSDVAIVTSDNPRTEDPDAIIDEIVTEMTPGSFERIADRRVAIAAALDMASADDIVLLAGKGHEDYQIIGTTKHPFDERVVVADLLTARREGGR